MIYPKNRDATEYVQAAVNACKRRLALLEDQKRRGHHDDETYERLRLATIAETEQAWDLSLANSHLIMTKTDVTRNIVARFTIQEIMANPLTKMYFQETLSPDGHLILSDWLEERGMLEEANVIRRLYTNPLRNV